MYDIILSAHAVKFLKKLDNITKERIIKTIERIRFKPEKYVIRLIGDKIYKFRVGNYRILLDIDKGKLTILVIEIDHRKRIYKK